MIQLGSEVRDEITGFQGIATGVVDYISGCRQVLINPPVDKEGKTRDAAWFDEQRVQLVPRGRRIELRNKGREGPDAPAPIR